MKKILLTAVCICSGLAASQAAQTTIAFDSGGLQVFDQNSNLLTAGPSGDGNGAVLQLGYYSGATAANNFLGTWIPLTGQGSLNNASISGSSPPGETFDKTSIGDLTLEGGVAGEFWFPGLTFVVGNANSGNNLPASNTIPLAIRFYNNTDINTSTFYNVVSDDAWLWKTPANPPNNPVVTMSLTEDNLEWLSMSLGQGANTAFHTTISTVAAVPEPSTIAGAILTAGAIGGHLVRRRRGKAA